MDNFKRNEYNIFSIYNFGGIVMDTLAPVVLFIYNRPDHTRQTLEALASNNLAQESDLFIFADGPKQTASSDNIEKIKKTREIAHSKQWCKNVTVIESNENKGLASSIISGVTEVVQKYGKVIVLEDDIVTGKYFLEYMNTALGKYVDKKEVWHITGWRNPVKNAVDGGSYFYPKMDCWGWATWADRWTYYKKDVAYYQSVFTDDMKLHFDTEGLEPGMWSQIEDNASGKINTWAVFWYATIFLRGGLCLAPTKSLVNNIGFDGSGVHCGNNTRFHIGDASSCKIVHFPEKMEISKKEYRKNIIFFKKQRRMMFIEKKVNLIKKAIRENAFLSPCYYFMKRLLCGPKE